METYTLLFIIIIAVVLYIYYRRSSTLTFDDNIALVLITYAAGSLMIYAFLTDSTEQTRLVAITLFGYLAVIVILMYIFKKVTKVPNNNERVMCFTFNE